MTSAGDLTHFLGESAGPELAGQVVQRSRFPAIEQPLEEEQQRHVARLLILHRLHGVADAAAAAPGYCAADVSRSPSAVLPMQWLRGVLSYLPPNSPAGTNRARYPNSEEVSDFLTYYCHTSMHLQAK